MAAVLKYLSNRQTGLGPANFHVSQTEMVRSVEQLRATRSLEHRPITMDREVAAGYGRPKESLDRNYIARLRFNKPGNVVGTSYWSHDAIELWSWQHHLYNHETPVPTLMNCSIVRFDWLCSNPEAHILVVGKYGDVKLIDLHRLMCYDLMGRHCSMGSMAYGLHAELPYNILYGLKSGLVRNFDVRLGPDPQDNLLMAKQIGSDRTYEIYSIAVNPANCNEFAIAGSTEDVRLYDRRKTKEPLHTMFMTTYPSLRSSKPGQPPNVALDSSYITDERRSRRWNLQEMAYSYNGAQLALSCGYDSIYLFDTSLKYPIGSYASNCLDLDEKNVASSITGSVVYGLQYFGDRSEFMVGMARGHEHAYDSEEFPMSRKRTSLYIWNSLDQKLVRRIPLNDRNWNFAVHPHLPVVATAHDRKGIQIWDAAIQID